MHTVWTCGIMRRVSLTARIGALSITTRSYSLAASATNWPKNRPARISAGFGARRPPAKTESSPPVVVRMFPVTAMFSSTIWISPAGIWRAAEAMFASPTRQSVTPGAISSSELLPASLKRKILCMFGLRRSPSIRRTR